MGDEGKDHERTDSQQLQAGLPVSESQEVPYNLTYF